MVSASAATSPLTWETATSVPPLPEGEVHIWRNTVDSFSGDISSILADLDETEAERARGFRFEKDFRRFVLRRAFLRRLLAAYDDLPVSGLRYAIGPQGKPRLNDAAPVSRLHFNTSHSDGRVVVAVTRGLEIGIDIERIREHEQWGDLARRFFSAAEANALAAYDSGGKSDAFFAGWTRKEAFVKALGGGLSIPLDRFSVTLDPDGEASVTATSPDMGPADEWQLFSFVPYFGFAAAIAYRGNARAILPMNDGFILSPPET